MRRIEEQGQLQLRQVVLRQDDSVRRRREKLARITLDEMVQFVGLLSTDGLMLEVNRAAVEGGGERLERLLGRPFWDAHWWAVDAPTQARLKEAVAQAARGEFVRYDVEVFGSASGEARITIDFSLKPVFDDEGQVVLLLAEGRDISEKKRAEAELARKNAELEALLLRVRELDEVKSRFFANVSHELRTPLTLILDPAAELSKQEGLSQEVQRQIALIQRNAALLQRRVQELLDMSKIMAGQMTLACEVTSLDRLVRECCGHFDGLAAQHDLRFVVDVEAACVYVDVEKIERILINVLSNAFRYTPRGGELEVSLRVSAEGVVLAVQDSGPGVPPALRERIFERFQQGDSPQRGGTGLGLTIARDFAALHGGALGVEDSARGARFVLRLPATCLREGADGAGARLAPLGELVGLQDSDPEEVSESGPLGAPLILVVEDSEELGEVIQRCLDGEHRVVRVRRAEQALKLSQTMEVSCLVTDLMLPGMSGDALLRALAAHGQRPHTLVLSARADDPLREALLEQGLAHDYMSKPFARRELLARVRGLVARSRTVKQLTERERQLEEAQALGQMGSWDWDVPTGALAWSRGHYALHGHDPARVEPSFELFMESVLPEERPGVLAALEATMVHGAPYELDMSVRRTDGALRVLHARGKLLRDAAGQPARMYGTVQDVTAQREMEERFKLHEVILRNMGEGVALVSATDEHIIYANPKFASMFGYTPDELEGQHVTLIHPDHASGSAQEEAQRVIAQLQAHGQATYETLNKHKDGRHILCRATASTIQHKAYGPVWVAVQGDITAQRAAEEALRASLKEREALLQEIHHRVKNNLQVVSSLLSLQANRLPDPSMREVLSQMQGRVRAIASLHEALYQGTSFARIDADSYLSDLVELIERTMERGVGQRIVVQPGALALQLREAVPCALILNELIGNALKHAGPQTTIWVSLREQAGQGVLTVRDDGPGYLAALDVATTRSMGLSLVRTLTRQLGGVLECSRDAGSCFTVHFPLSPGQT